jgi:hypothetical protein
MLTIGAALTACSDRPALQEIIAPVDTASIERGKALVTGLAACGSCHSHDAGKTLNGGTLWSSTGEALHAPNLTPAADGGIAAWRVSELVTLFREGVRPDGESLSAGVHAGYEWLSERDLLSIISYLITLEPRTTPPVVRRESNAFRERLSLYAPGATFVTGYVPEIHYKNVQQYGAYLANHVARCGTCHDSVAGVFSDPLYFSGGRVIREEDLTTVAPALTGPTRANWDEDRFFTYLTTSRDSESAKLREKLCPTEYYRQAPHRELKALSQYLAVVAQREKTP